MRAYKGRQAVSTQGLLIDMLDTHTQRPCRQGLLREAFLIRSVIPMGAPKRLQTLVDSSIPIVVTPGSQFSFTIRWPTPFRQTHMRP